MKQAIVYGARPARVSRQSDESGYAARAGRDGQRTLPDEPEIQACDWTVWLALPCGAG